MGRARLRTQLWLAAVLMVCALLSAILLMVRAGVTAAVDRQIGAGTSQLARSFAALQRERATQLARGAALLADVPPLKALMTTNDPRTIQDAAATYFRLSGADLFVLADPSGRVEALYAKAGGWRRAEAESAVRAMLARPNGAAWWFGGGRLYQTLVSPITAGAGAQRRPLGLLVIGYQADRALAAQLAFESGAQIALGSGAVIVTSTLPPPRERALAAALARGGGGSEDGIRDFQLGGERYQGAAVIIQRSPPVAGYVLMSLRPADDFLRSLTRLLLLAGLAAMALMALLFGLVARATTRPLDELVAGVRALAAGDYAYAISPRGASEVAELSRAFASMREELLAAQRRWRAAERRSALGRAAQSISHDLRHYMAAVVANAEFLYEAERLRLNRDEVYAEIKLASAQITELLDSLRELAREESIVPAPHASLRRGVARALAAARARPEFRDRLLRLRAEGEMNGVYDAKKLERAFFNLILNACEATPAGGRVEVELWSDEHRFEARFHDNGVGVPAAIRDTLFDPFVSAGKPNGTGLGLTIVAKIIQEHGGSVLVESTSPEGTTFLVRLPRFARPHERMAATTAT